MIANIIYALGGIVESLIGLRIILRLVGANPANGIVEFIYNWSTPFVAPFSGIFGVDATALHEVGSATTSVFDWTALIALIVIGVIVGLIGTALGRPRRV